MSKSETEVITVSYHDLLNLYGDGERLEAEHREFVYVQQPKRYKTPEDIARKDADIARQIERMERLIDDSIVDTEYLAKQAAAKRERIAAAEASGITEPVKPDCYPAGRWNGKVYGTAAYGYRIYVDNAEVQISNDDADALKRYAKALAAWREATAAKETSP